MEDTNIVSWGDFYCGNHSRNLHFDEFNRNFAAHVKSTLGPALEVRDPNSYSHASPSSKHITVYRQQRHVQVARYGWNHRAKI